nr:MAG TPA: hypothetical protein [Caudoviricetes sp.]
MRCYRVRNNFSFGTSFLPICRFLALSLPSRLVRLA